MPSTLYWYLVPRFRYLAPRIIIGFIINVFNEALVVNIDWWTGSWYPVVSTLYVVRNTLYTVFSSRYPLLGTLYNGYILEWPLLKTL